MSDQFGRYEQDLLSLIKETKTKLSDKLTIIQNVETRKSLQRQIQKEIDDMTALIQDMEFEINRAAPNSKLTMSNKLKIYKKDVELIQKDLKKAINLTQSSPINNYGSIIASNDDYIDPDRRRLLQMHNTLNQTSESIMRSTQIAVETERIGVDVLSEINSQGEQLRRANERVLSFFTLLK
jgi:vesicle transport through interaction with t-SNAREs 1